MNAKIDITGVKLETERLILREWYLSDLDDLFEYASIPGVGEMAGWPHHPNKEESLIRLKKFIEEKKTFAVVYKENHKVIGSLGIEKYGAEDKLSEFFPYKGREIGYVLSKDYWERGLMTEAVKEVINYLFNVLDYDFLLCGHFDRNLRSGRVQEKCGFLPYRKLVYDTKLNTTETGVLTLQTNPRKEVVLKFSHPETLLIKNSKVIETERLILRKPQESDYEPMFRNWASDPEVTKYLTWNAHENIDVTKQTLSRWLEQEKDFKTVRYMITLKGSDEPFGSIDVVNYKEGIPEIGYCLSKKLWNNGYMTEACKTLVKHLFDCGYNKVLICADKNNIGSNRVIAKCGFAFTHEEYKEHCSAFKSEPVTLNWYEIKKL